MTNGCCGGRQMKAAEHEMSPAFGRILEKRFATARSTKRSLRMRQIISGPREVL
jgi:hypothetical protein